MSWVQLISPYNLNIKMANKNNISLRDNCFQSEGAITQITLFFPILTYKGRGWHIKHHKNKPLRRVYWILKNLWIIFIVQWFWITCSDQRGIFRTHYTIIVPMVSKIIWYAFFGARLFSSSTLFRWFYKNMRIPEKKYTLFDFLTKLIIHDEAH